MTRLKVMTIVGTRPEIIRLSRVMARLDAELDHVLVHTGQNYDHELNQIFFDDLELRPPDHYLDAAGHTAAETIGQVIIATDRILGHVRPEAVLILGDTNSALAAAIPAKRRRIPVFHMEAGNRCFDARVPEEINRRLVDHLADINLPYGSIAREYLLREGFPPHQVIVTGSPMFEVLQHAMPKIERSSVLSRLSLEPDAYFVVSVHREENVESSQHFSGLIEILTGLATMGTRVIVSTHPRTRRRFDEQRVTLPAGVELHKPFAFTDYVALQRHASAVLSDSGTISEEASILNLRALNLREAHERPEAMEEGVVMMTGLNWTRVRQGLDILANQPRGETRALRLVRDYDVPNVSDKVLRIVMSYVDYVRRVVWQERS